MGERADVYDVQAIRARLLAKMGEHSGHYPLHLEERFPHILERVAELWGTPALDAFLEVLMLPDRLDRQGFPPEVAMEIFSLFSVHGELGLAPLKGQVRWDGIEETARDKTTPLRGR